MEAPETHRAIDAVWRIESPRLIAGIAAIVRDIGLAEELAQDALVAALEQWPESGVPRNPGAWLMAIGRRRAIDYFRRQERLGRKLDEIGRSIETATPEPTDQVAGALDREIQDDLLRLIFTACHPLIPAEARVALTLRIVGGLTTHEIARAYLVSEATVAQRIVRAKRTLATAHVPFEVPAPAERPQRLSSVLEVIYLIFTPMAKAIVMRQTLRGGRAGTFGPILIAVSGLALIIGGIFTTDAGLGFPAGAPDRIPDPLSWHAQIHSFSFFVAIISIVLASVVFARRFAGLRQWRWLAYCAITAAAMPALVVFGMTNLNIVGVAFFAMAIVMSSWNAAVALHVRSDSL
jgi:RNA polymerase sigma factor (sigma-70 family)